MPVSSSFGDIYFSAEDGLAETRAVFLAGCDLPARWQNGAHTICELGFGSGLNFLAVLDEWQRSPGAGPLHYVAIEAYPWTQDQLGRAHSAFPQLAKSSERLRAQWPGRVRGWHRLHFGGVILTLIHDEVANALRGMETKIDSWFLDGFSPAKNPDMWRENIYSEMARLSARGARAATFTVAGIVKNGLRNAGFEISKKPGFGKKRERLEAVFERALKPAESKCQRPIIIGTGIGGASLARGFLSRGVRPAIIDAAPDLSRAASGNWTALVTPRLDMQDRPESRFFLSAYLYALTTYSPFAKPSGLIRMAKNSEREDRFQKLAEYAALPGRQMQFFTSSEIAQMAKVESEYGGLFFPRAMAISPHLAIGAFCDGADIRPARVGAIENGGDYWRVLDHEGEAIAKGDAVFVAAGAETADLIDIELEYQRGQIIKGTGAAPTLPVSYGGYGLGNGDQLILGASHVRCGMGHDGQINSQETEEILAQYTVNTGKKMLRLDGARASVRAARRNTYPLAFAARPGLYVLGGLSGRGFSLAPLLGEYLASLACNEPPPICNDTALRLTPGLGKA